MFTNNRKEHDPQAWVPITFGEDNTIHPFVYTQIWQEPVEHKLDIKNVHSTKKLDTHVSGNQVLAWV
jgi:hypothetical protein